MPISESTEFIFNGVLSSSHGIQLVHLRDGMLEEPFISNRSLVETKVRGKSNPFFVEIDQEPKEFSLTFAIATGFQTYATGILTFSGVVSTGQTVTINGAEIYEFCETSVGGGHYAVALGSSFTVDNAVETLAETINSKSVYLTALADIDENKVYVTALTAGTSGNSITTTETCTNASWGNTTLLGGTDSSSNLRSILKWLVTDYYCSLVFETEPTKVYYAILTNPSTLTHINNQGYFTANFRCNSPYCYSQLVSTETYDLSANGVGGTTITIYNNGDKVTYPYITMTMCSGSNFSIENRSNASATMAFTGIANAEVLTIDCENEDITSNASLTYRYDDMTGDFTQLVTGTNNLQVYGNVMVQFQYEYIYLA